MSGVKRFCGGLMWFCSGAVPPPAVLNAEVLDRDSHDPGAHARQTQRHPSLRRSSDENTGPFIKMGMTK